MSDELEKPEECEACAYETDALTLSSDGPGMRQVWLCEICSGTMSGNSAIYPRNYDVNTQDVLRTIAYAANCIIAEIRKLKP